MKPYLLLGTRWVIFRIVQQFPLRILKLSDGEALFVVDT
jgi:hypothetical protein